MKILSILLLVTTANAACLENHHVKNTGAGSTGECHACPAHSTRPAGDDETANVETFCVCDIGHAANNTNGSCDPCGTNQSTSVLMELDQDRACDVCLQGFTSSDAPTTVCDIACPTGQTTATDFTFANAACNACDSGYFTEDGLVTGCTICPSNTHALGSVLVGGAATQAERCLVCAENNSVSSGGCVACPTGHTNTAGDVIANGDSTCDGCIDGYHSQSGVCTPCATGTYTAAGTNESDTACSLCFDEFMVDNNSCVACPSGSKSDSFADPSGNDTLCEICLEGYHLAGGACEPCEAGSTKPQHAVDIAGWAVSSDDETCTQCLKGYHVGEVDGSAEGCVACPAGKTTTSTTTISGATATEMSSAHCSLCFGNYFVKQSADDSSVYTCSPCSEGYMNSEPTGVTVEAANSQVTINNVNECPMCAEDYYVNSDGECTACGANQTIAAGFAVADGQNSCTCKLNFRVNESAACVACPVGYSRAAGDNPAGSETNCFGCAEGYYSLQADDGTWSCSQCAAGTSRVADTSATQALSASSTCDKCAAGFKGNDTGNGCTACTGATTNTGLTAMSASVCGECAEDFHVVSGVCTACASGYTNPAGDDPNGNDTSCTLAPTPAPTPATTPVSDDNGDDTDTPTTTPTTAPTDASSAAAIGIAAAVAAAVPLIL